MVDVEEAFAGGQLVSLFDLLQPSDCQEHSYWRSQSKEILWLKVQRVVHHRYLCSGRVTTILLFSLQRYNTILQQCKNV